MKKKSYVFNLLFATIVILLIGGFIYKFEIVTIGKKETLITNSKNESEKNNIISISSINEEMIGIEGTVQGKIDKAVHSKGHLFLTVSDSSGTLVVPIFSNNSIVQEPFIEGAVIEVTGEIELYEGQIEVIPQKNSDIKVVENALTNSKVIDEQQLGETIKVIGKILSKYEHPDKHIFLDIETEDNQTLKITIFSSLNADPSLYSTNSKVEIEGEVQEYKGEIQLVPHSIDNIKIVESISATTASVSLSSITKENRGKTVVVEAMVDSVKEHDGNLFLQLSWDTTTINAVLFKADNEENIGRKMRIENAFNSKFPIRLEANVNIYKENLELVIDKVLVD